MSVRCGNVIHGKPCGCLQAPVEQIMTALRNTGTLVAEAALAAVPFLKQKPGFTGSRDHIAADLSNVAGYKCPRCGADGRWLPFD